MERSRNIKLITRGFLWRSKTVHHLFIYPSIHSLIHSFIKHKLRAYSVPRRDVSTSMMAIILSRFYSQTPQYSSGQRTEVHVSSSVVFPFTFHRPQNLFFFKRLDFFIEREREREQAGEEAEGERISNILSTEQGAPPRAQSQNPEIMTWAESKSPWPNPLRNPGTSWIWTFNQSTYLLKILRKDGFTFVLCFTPVPTSNIPCNYFFLKTFCLCICPQPHQSLPS